MERFNLKKVNEVEGRNKHRVEISSRFVTLEDMDAEVEINTIWETILHICVYVCVCVRARVRII
jgi:hypothetical protein